MTCDDETGAGRVHQPRRAGLGTVAAPDSLGPAPGDAAADSRELPPDNAGRHRATARRRSWVRRHVRRVLVGDVVAVGAAATLAKLIRYGPTDGTLLVGGRAVSYALVAALVVPTWVLMVASSGGYEGRMLGPGSSEELRRVMEAGLRFVALLSIAVFVFNLDLSRGFVAGIVPLAVVFTVVGRLVSRRVLLRQRRAGRSVRRVLVVGTIATTRDLARHFDGAPWAGYRVVAACVPASSAAGVEQIGPAAIPVLGSAEDIDAALDISGADVLAVANDGTVGRGGLRSLAWRLEGRGIDLVVAPSVTDVAGPRITIRPVNGLPLLHLEEPRLDGVAGVGKACFDRVVSAVALVVLAPLLVGVAVAVKVTSRGPVLFRQERIGYRGTEFSIYKFRSMVDGADGAKEQLRREAADGDLLFKLRYDPRITSVGRVLRRWSIDELPQLLNVLRGQMSLVGPRPLPKTDVERSDDHGQRRYLVKPGITGLWQVNGRSELPWDEALRLDLHYIDNWSLGLDLAILARTASAWASGRGAY